MRWSLERILGRVFGTAEKARNDGPPPGLDASVLQRICADRLGGAPTAVSHYHLSGWKLEGAHRVFLRIGRGKERTLVFKNEICSPTRNPALRDLPIRPGPPEYEVYRQPVASLLQYLPEIYLCEEVVEGEHYRFLFEDLGTHYRYASARDRMEIVATLPAIHCALEEQFADRSVPRRIICYRERAGCALLRFFRASIERYIAETADDVVAELAELWPAIERVYTDDSYLRRGTQTVIHGDPNLTNVHVGRNNRGQLKLVDWEWVGHHVAEADLCSILKDVSEEEENEGLRVFRDAAGVKTPGGDRSLYDWCKVERALLDISYLAVVRLDSSKLEPGAGFGFDLENYIRKAVARLKSGLDRLRS